MNNAIAIAQESINKQRLPLVEEKERLESRLREIDGFLQKLDAANDALSDNKSLEKKKKQYTKAFAKKPDVMKLCNEFVKENAPIPKDDLASLIKERLSKKMGFSLSNVPRLIGTCLESPSFQVDSQNRVSLAAKSYVAEGENGVDQNAIGRK